MHAQVRQTDLGVLLKEHIQDLKIPKGFAIPVDRLVALAGQIPFVTGAIVEFHLRKRSKRLDLAVRFSREYSEAELLAKTQSSFRFSKKMFLSAPFQNLQKFGKAWNNPQSILHNGIENVWLEFDLPKKQNTLAPSIFFDIDRNGRLSKKQQMDLVLQSLALLEGQGIDNNALTRFLDHCPEPGKLYYTGTMLSRKKHTTRLCFKGWPSQKIFSYLDEIGWPGNSAQLKKVIQPYLSMASDHIIDLDFNEQLFPEIGFELFFDSASQWEKVFEKLKMNGACYNTDKEFCLNWASNPITPAGSKLPKKKQQQSFQYLIRRLNHIKINIRPDGTHYAKAYLYFATESTTVKLT